MHLKIKGLAQKEDILNVINNAFSKLEIENIDEYNLTSVNIYFTVYDKDLNVVNFCDERDTILDKIEYDTNKNRKKKVLKKIKK